MNLKQLLTLALLAPICLFAQDDNLIQNGSFEEVKGKIKKPGQIKNVLGWISPTDYPADVFVVDCKNPNYEAGLNFYGNQEASEGSNYLGLVAISKTGK